MREKDLYEPLARSIQSLVQARFKHAEVHALVTAAGRRAARSTGGRWTRPDITLLVFQRFQHVPARRLEVWTFEVKPPDRESEGRFVDIMGVFEAASHLRCAHRSFAVLQYGSWSRQPAGAASEDPEGNEYDPVLPRCIAEAARLGVGLVFFDDSEIDLPGKWAFHEPVTTNRPELHGLDSFIEQHLSGDEAILQKIQRFRA